MKNRHSLTSSRAPGRPAAKDPLRQLAPNALFRVLARNDTAEGGCATGGSPTPNGALAGPFPSHQGSLPTGGRSRRLPGGSAIRRPRRGLGYPNADFRVAGPFQCCTYRGSMFKPRLHVGAGPPAIVDVSQLQLIASSCWSDPFCRCSEAPQRDRPHLGPQETTPPYN